MGVSFKVSKTGKRFRPKPLELDTPVGGGEEDDTIISSSIKKSDHNFTSSRTLTVEAGKNGGVTEISDNDVSFTLSLFPDGYSIGKPVENDQSNQTPVDVPKFLHTYDRASETLFSAIEAGRLPGDILDDLPCKYIEGTVVCEVRDYRNCSSETGVHVASGDASPSVLRVCLRMSLENLVKDIPSISEDGWTYGDLMEVEARMLKALQPQLCLDPSPKLDRLSDNPVPTKLNLAVHSLRRKRLRQIHEATVSSNNKIHGKRVCIDKVPESLRLGDWRSLMQQSVQENLNTQNNLPSAMLPIRTNSFGSDIAVSASSLVSPQSKFQMGVGSPSLLQDNRPGAPLNASIASPAGQDMISLTDNGASSVHCKRENQDGQLSPLLNKRVRLTATGVDGSQHVGQQMDSFNGPDSHWKNTLMQQQSVARGIHYANNSMKKFSQQVFEGGLNQDVGAMPFTAGQQGMRYGLKEEPIETERLDKTDLSRIHMAESGITHIDSSQSRLQQRMPQQFGRAGFPQTSWNSLGQPLDNNSRKEDFQKRKLVQSPRVSAGGLPQSPLSSKSGEFSSSSIGPQFGGVVTSGLVSSQKEKSAVTSVPPIGVGGTTSLTSSVNDSMQRQNQAQAAAKRRSNSKTTAIIGIGSPASVSNMNAMINANSPVGAQLADQAILERFSKIEMMTSRYQLNSKKNKVDQYPLRKPNTFSAQLLLTHISSDSNNENLIDETCKMPLSRSLVGGNMNVPKTRILNFFQTERVLQGNGFPLVPKARTRMIMSEKPNDGSVAMHIGEIEYDDYLASEDYLPTLPNTHTADLLAEQFCSLMTREGYHHEDHVQLKPVHINEASTSQLNGRGIPSGTTPVKMQQYSDGVSSLPSNDIAKPSNSGNVSVSSSQNIQGLPMVPPPGNTQVMQISQGLLPGVSMTSRPQQPELLPSLQQQPQPSPQQHQHSLMQQQHPQYQRSPMMFSPNSMPHLNAIGQNANMQLGAHMANKPSTLQLQLMQQPQMQRKMMGGLGTVGMGNIGNNMVGLGGLNNVMGIGGIRGVGATGISAPMGSISNIGNMTQNPMNLARASNLNNALRPGTFTSAQAALMAKVRVEQNRSNMLGVPQASISGMSGGRQLHPGSAGLSMLGPSLNRANINQMQHTAMGPMGPPKLMPGMNLYMNQQHQQQQQLQQQQQQQNQQLQQQQESTSPLQAVLSRPQVGSPSSIGIPHQMNQQAQQQASPQQMSQRTPMSPQLSSGAIHPMSAGNVEACPASPQLSSHAMGSVGSITNSSMELQGVNKNNPIGNA